MPRHSFVAATCIGLAEEWAREMDRRIVPIIREPDQPEPGGISAASSGARRRHL
ncbi:MAG: hypothetical protein H0T04_06565 [Chloroflexi bacterium]|nr:hypothetical protein [Chloroflexota bacterium]